MTKNIVVFRTHRFGDILQTFPMIKGIREKYAPCKIFFVVDHNYHEVVRKSNLVDEVVAIPYSLLNTQKSDKELMITDVYQFCLNEINKLKERGIYLFINRSYSNFSALFGAAINSHNYFGKQYQQDRGYFYDDTTSQLMRNVVNHRKSQAIHLIDFGCRMTSVQPSSRQLQFIPDDADQIWWSHQKNQYGIGANQLLVGIQMGANKAFRHWGEQNFAQVIQTVGQLLNNQVKFLIFGQQTEYFMYQNLTSFISPNNVINFMGKTSFGQLAIALSHCKFLLTGDTGTMHLATAVATPVLALFFASAFYRETGPYGLNHYVLVPELECYPCYHPEACPSDLQCRKLITVPAVIKVIKMMLNMNNNNSITFDRLNLLSTKFSPMNGEINYIHEE